MIIDLSNKRALVGGSSQGLGLAAAMQLAASGATVTLMASNATRLQQALATLPCPKEQTHQYLVVDFSNFEQFKTTIAAYFQKNTVDILINNTQGPKAGTVLEQDDMAYAGAFNLLFQPVQYTTSLALKHMQAKQWGRIINLTSRTVKEPADNLALSNSIRAAVVAWGKTLSRAVAKDQVTVNNILTGNFDTDRLRQLFQLQADANKVSLENIIASAEKDIPVQRLGLPEELAHVVAFLASPQASYITGTSIPVDGGLLRSI